MRALPVAVAVRAVSVADPAVLSSWLKSACESWMEASMAFQAGTEVELMLKAPSISCQAAMLA